MSVLLAAAIAGWTGSAALALALARRRASALAAGERLAAVVHELRGPLQAAEFILTGARRVAGAEAAGGLQALEVELGRLRLAVGDLQGTGRRAALHPGRAGATCDAAALLRDLAPGWCARAATEGRAVRVHPPTPPVPVAADRLRLAQALGNLVANALEHGRGDVEVRLTAAPDGAPQIEVRDEGPGLPASVAALVARPPDPERARGRGLGIAARIAADAGGRLWAAPAARGSRLVLRLPAPGAAGVSAGPAGPMAQ